MISVSLRRLLLVLAALSLALTAGACSKKKDDAGGGLTQDEADELMQLTASMAAADSGGWMSEVLATWNSTPTVAARGTSWSVATGDTTFSRGFVNWAINFTYYGPTETPSETFADTTEYVEYLATGSGRIPIVPFGPASGFAYYGHVSDTTLVDGFTHDTLYTFKGHATVDSALITVNSSSGARYYYVDNVLDYDLSFLPGAVFPSSGIAEITAFVEVLNSLNRNDRDGYFDVSITVTFDGTQTPVAEITLSTDAVTRVYRYRLDLRSGALARI